MGKGGLSAALAKSVARREHKERSQPAHRRKYGLLEKKKDYRLRARDFHRKEKAVKALRRKAEERNPDEFYFAMETARTRNGVHIVSSTEANKYTQEELRLMKTQDEKYLTTTAKIEEKKVARMQDNLHFIGAAAGGQHTVFVDSAGDARTFSAAEYFDTPEELVGRSFNRPRRAQLADPAALNLPAGPAGGELLAKLERRKATAYRHLAERSERQAKLRRLADAAAADKAVMAPGRKRKLGKGEVAEGAPQGVKQFKWKRERKR